MLEGYLLSNPKSISLWRPAALSKEVEEGTFTISDEFEDVHSKIEYELTKTYGDVGKKSILRVRETIRCWSLSNSISKMKFKKSSNLSKRYLSSIWLWQIGIKINCYRDTHLQIAMPSSFGLWFSAYAEILVDEVLLLNTVHTMWPKSTRKCCWLWKFLPNWPTWHHSNARVWHLKYNVVAAQMSRGKLEKTWHKPLVVSLERWVGFRWMSVCIWVKLWFYLLSRWHHNGLEHHATQKNPDVFELICGKCNKLQALPNELTLMSTNLPSGYYREMQLFKGPIMQAIETKAVCQWPLRV